MSIHHAGELRRLGALTRRIFSVAHMSDTKWRKLFEVLRETSPEVQMRVTFVDSAEPRDLGMPREVWLHAPRPYVDTFAFGPIALRAIAWLGMPAVIFRPRGHGLPDQEIAQDLDTVAARLAALGRFPLERTACGLRVIGYAR